MTGARIGLSRLWRALAVTVAVATTGGQFLALSHEITVRHVRCGEHGELTHVAVLLAAPPLRAQAPLALRTEETEAAGGHEHCATGLALQGALSSQLLRTAAPAVAPPVVAAPAPALRPCNRAALLASAPKTSPPSA